ncbi:MAG TPA: hypothetical protein VFM94_03430 [Solirubrobacterales bacterium]|nr:hypothetical protein [Solirubrobacterales bacterium]
MFRNLKTFGLVLAMALALSSLAASSVSAGMITADGPVTLKMTAKEAGDMFLTGGQKLDCPGSVYTGHKVDSTPHVPLAKGFSEATITPHYKNCTAGNLKVTITMNGCDWGMAILGEIAPGVYLLGSVIDCPNGKKIVEDTYSSSSEGLKLCETSIEPQEDLTGTAAIEEGESGNLMLEGSFEGIHTVNSGLCGASTSSAGKWELGIEIEGLSEGEESTGLSLSE